MKRHSGWKRTHCFERELRKILFKRIAVKRHLAHHTIAYCDICYIIHLLHNSDVVSIVYWIWNVMKMSPTLPARVSARAPATSGRCWYRRWAPRAHPCTPRGRSVFRRSLPLVALVAEDTTELSASASISDVATAVPGARPNSRAAAAVTPVPSVSPAYCRRALMRAASFSSWFSSPIAR